MQYVYICGAVSEKMNDALGRSVAGNKFSLNMAKALDQCSGGTLTFISTAAIPQSTVDEFGGEVWPGKKLCLAPRGKRFLLAELQLKRNIQRWLKQVRKEHPQEPISVFLENAPFAGATACAASKKNLGLSCYSITIDTPFAGGFQERGVLGRINGWMFRKGLRALRKFDGLISFTEEVKCELGVEIPFCPLSIGCRAESIPEQVSPMTAEKSAMYAGTLIEYNGIQELLQAFILLGEEYQLHLYGYGPLEKEVQAAAQQYSNIHFHGRFSPTETEKILSRHQLLINPRRIDPKIENFTFPSKMVDYLLAGKSVLSSDFKTLPKEYGKFVSLIQDMKPETIAESVRALFDEDLAMRQARAQAGIEYIKQNQTYDSIAERVIRFVKN